MDGGKLSIPLSVPYGIIADTQLMKTAPDEMLSSGVGDILGKYVALCDWKLARREMDEYFCAAIADMIDTALTRCVNGIAKLGGRDPEAVLAMADTLIMSGVAISMHGISRPASGCEHQLAHYWEVALLDGDADCPLHGNFVGFGTEVACRLYEMAGKEFDLVFPYRLPTSDEIRGYMRLLGDYSSIKTLGITRDLLYDSFFHATEANGRYTLITFLKDKGRLDYYAKAITDSYFSA
jgi:glycerol-1-phosphate dehydrogenase [NAD(P)+]